MTDDDFEDIVEQVCYYYPMIAQDLFAKSEYDRAVAKVVNTGGEEQRAHLLEVIEELGAVPIEDYELRTADPDDQHDESDISAQTDH